MKLLSRHSLFSPFVCLSDRFGPTSAWRATVTQESRQKDHSVLMQGTFIQLVGWVECYLADIEWTEFTFHVVSRGMFFSYLKESAFICRAWHETRCVIQSNYDTVEPQSWARWTRLKTIHFRIDFVRWCKYVSFFLVFSFFFIRHLTSWTRYRRKSPFKLVPAKLFPQKTLACQLRIGPTGGADSLWIVGFGHAPVRS